MPRLIAIVLILLNFLLPALAEEGTLKGVALVIGQSKYQHLLDGAGIARRVDQFGEVSIFRLADDQRHPLERSFLCHSGKKKTQ